MPQVSAPELVRDMVREEVHIAGLLRVGRILMFIDAEGIHPGMRRRRVAPRRLFDVSAGCANPHRLQ